MKSIILSFREGRVPRVPNVGALLRAFPPNYGRARVSRAVTCVSLLLSAILIQSAHAQIQQAWMTHYNNGITNGTNQAAKMVLDSSGNIYVTGFSQNSHTNLGYVTIKYASNGTQSWATRYDSTITPLAMPAAMAIDASDNVAITGTALTVKYDGNGNQLWTAPYAGSCMAVDSSANIYVAGFSQDFGTVKLSPQGSNVWLTTYIDSYGKTVSQSVLVDNGNNVCVSGLDSYYSFVNNGILYGPYVTLTTIKYDSNGNQLWKVSNAPEAENQTFQLEGAALDAADNIYLTSYWPQNGDGYYTIKYANVGSLIWSVDPNNNARSIGDALAVDHNQCALITGRLPPPPNYNYTAYGTYKLNTNGATIYEKVYPILSQSTTSVGTAIAVDSANNSYVTGYSPGTNGTNNIVTIKYDPNGNMVWLQRYSSPGGGNAAGNAIAVDKNGNVYVTGYDTTAAGGTEIVTIKYSPVTVQRRSDGTVILQAQGSPGESFDIEASCKDLLNWLDLGTFLADTNGLLHPTPTPQLPLPLLLHDAAMMFHEAPASTVADGVAVGETPTAAVNPPSRRFGATRTTALPFTSQFLGQRRYALPVL